MIKRILDIILSLIGIAFVLPFFPFVALLIKLDSKGPVFYLANRVGKGMRYFKMYKFRTMIDTPIQLGQSVCPQYDPRVTFFGRFLRRTKMNELPQLLNILKGEMTFVGPRPEAPDLAELYPHEATRVFSVKPGLVGPGTILGRNEEECYPPGVDAKKYYIDHILPSKVKLDLDYIDNPTLFKDIVYIFEGIKETAVGTFSKKHITDNSTQIFLIIADFFLTKSSYIFAHAINPLSYADKDNLKRHFVILALVIFVRFCCYVYFGLYGSLIRYISFHDIVNVLKSIITSSLFIVLITRLLGWYDYTNFIAVVDGICLVFLLAGLRLSLRFYWERKRGKSEEKLKRRVFIYGAGDVGFKALNAMSAKHSRFKAIGFIDDEAEKYGKAINGSKVLGNRYHIKELAKLYRADELLIAEQETNPDDLLEIVKICRASKLRCLMLPYANNNNSGGRVNLSVRNIEFSDLLPLERIHADPVAVKKVIADKTVLINGTGGALGLELCRKILHNGCSRLIIVERYESYLNEAVSSLMDNISNLTIIPILLDLDNSASQMLDDVFKRYHPDIVIQAGMRKYKPVFDIRLGKKCRTYYRYTFNLARLAVAHKCNNFIVISSLMARQNGNSVADFLREAEVSLCQFFKNTDTCLTISRIPDIAENRGGIVSLLEEQIINHRTVILPLEETKYCLITKNAAAEFILQTIVEDKNKLQDQCIFTCNTGFTISLIELIRRLSSYHGLKLWTDLEVKYLEQSNETSNFESLTMESV